jgi:hypothetical protein
VLARNAIIAIVLVGSVAWTSGSPASTSDTSQAGPTATQKPGARLGTHAVTGTVRFVNDSTLVIVCSGKNATEMTFVLEPETCRDGKLNVGSAVSVRYLEKGRTLIATGVFVHERPDEVPVNSR